MQFNSNSGIKFEYVQKKKLYNMSTWYIIHSRKFDIQETSYWFIMKG